MKKLLPMLYFVLGASVFALLFHIFSLFGWQNAKSATLNEYLIKLNSNADGRISELNFIKNSKVTKGQIIARIDGEIHQKKYMDIDKKLSETIKKFKVAKKQVDNFEKNKNKAQETLYSATKDVERANTDYIMYSNEYRDGTVTEEDFTNAINNLKKAQENYKEMQYQYAQEVELLKDAQYKKGYLEKQINNFITELNKVEFELMQATVVAPSNAKIAEQNVHLHDMVQKNATLFILAPDSCSVDAKFEKNDKIQIGQKAQVLLKSYPYPLKGTVEGIKEDGTVKIIIKSNVVKCNTDTKEEDIKVKVKVR